MQGPQGGERQDLGEADGQGGSWVSAPWEPEGDAGPPGLGWRLSVGVGVRPKPTAGLRGGEDAAGAGSRVQVRWEWWPGVGRQWMDFRCLSCQN